MHFVISVCEKSKKVFKIGIVCTVLLVKIIMCSFTSSNSVPTCLPDSVPHQYMEQEVTKYPTLAGYQPGGYPMYPGYQALTPSFWKFQQSTFQPKEFHYMNLAARYSPTMNHLGDHQATEPVHPINDQAGFQSNRSIDPMHFSMPQHDIAYTSNNYYYASSPSPETVQIRKRRGTKRKVTFTKEQKLILESAFDENPYVAKAKQIELSTAIGVSPLQIKTWFQNRRMKKAKSCSPEPNTLIGGKEISMPVCKRKRAEADLDIFSRPWECERIPCQQMSANKAIDRRDNSVFEIFDQSRGIVQHNDKKYLKLVSERCENQRVIYQKPFEDKTVADYESVDAMQAQPNNCLHLEPWQREWVPFQDLVTELKVKAEEPDEPTEYENPVGFTVPYQADNRLQLGEHETFHKLSGFEEKEKYLTYADIVNSIHC